MPKPFELSRRAILRGTGALIGLPFLEAMLPSIARAQAAGIPPPRRLVVMHVPNGVIMNAWTPTAAGFGFPLSPILQPLSAYAAEMTVLTNLANAQSDKSTGVDLGHEGPTGSIFSAVPVNASPLSNGITVDQVAANALKQYTQIPYLAMGNSACGYNTLPFLTHSSWADAVTPIPKIVNPYDVFTLIFPTPTASPTQQTAAAALRRKKSILDFVQADAATLQKKLGTADRARLDSYLTNIRAVESQLQSTVTVTCAPTSPPPNWHTPDNGSNPGPSSERTSFTQLMFDMIALAFSCDATRAVSFQWSIGVDDLTYEFLPNVSTNGHHAMTHDTSVSGMGQTQTIDTWETQMLAYLCGKLSSIQEATSNALHNSLICVTSEIGDGANHDTMHLPTLLLGSAGGAIKAGQHIIYPDGTPRANLYVSMLNAVGVPTTSFGADGTAPLSGLT